MNIDDLNYLISSIETLTEYSDGTVLKVDFDKEGYNKRCEQYDKIVTENKLSIFEAAKQVDISYNDFINEIHVYAALNPCKVSIKYLAGYFRSALTKQKEIDAVCWMKENHNELSIDYICERLNIPEKQALGIIKRHKMNAQLTPETKKKMPLSYIEMCQNESVQFPIIQYFNQNPYVPIRNCIKDLKLNTSETALRNALETLIDQGYKIPCFVFKDSMTAEKEMAEIVAYKEANPYATSKFIATKFNTTPSSVEEVLLSAAEEYRVEKLKSFEFYFKRVLDEIEEIGQLCSDRFHASPNSSSRWLEIKQMGLEKKIRMLGLNAPTDIRIQHNVQIESKEEKDAILDAYMATNFIDVTPVEASV